MGAWVDRLGVHGLFAGPVGVLLLAAAVQAQAVPTVTVQHSWSTTSASGYGPQGALVPIDDGASLVGTMALGGPFGAGTIYRIGIDGTGFQRLHAFTGADGANPERALARGPDGWWYGVAPNGGASSAGTAFRMDALGNFELLHSFTGGGRGTGSNPNGPLVWADGAWWGTTRNGGIKNAGTVFRMTAAGVVTVMYSFNRVDGVAGHLPLAGLTLAPDGRLWGTTSKGAGGGGAVFAITPQGVLSKMHEIDKLTQGVPGRAALTVASDGHMYLPTTARVLRVALDGSTTALAYQFVGPALVGQAVDPSNASLWAAPDGMLYGTAVAGGHAQQGVIYRILPGTSVSVLHDFTGTPSSGARPNDALVVGGDGALYATTTSGGRGGGTLVRLADWTVAYVPTLAFASATSVQNEGVVAAVELPLSRPADNGFIPVITFGGTAQLGAACETTGTDAVVNVLPTRVGDTAARVHVRACADRFEEGDETITLALGTAEAYEAGSQRTHLLTIPANAASNRTMRFSVPDVVARAGDVLNLRVRYSESTSAAVAPPFAAPSDDAQRGLTCAIPQADFTPRPRYVPAGESSSVIAVHLCSNAVAESDETFSIRLKPNNLYGVDASSTINITIQDAPQDPRPTMSFADGHLGLVEGEPAKFLILNLSQPATREVVFSVTMGGSGRQGKCTDAGSDYYVKRPVKAMPGDTVVKIEVQACSDNLVEGHEAGDISVYANADYRLGAYGSTRLEISDVL